MKMCLNETYSSVHIGKNLSDKFHIQNGLEQGGALSPVLFNFVWNMPTTGSNWLKPKRTQQLMTYADDINIVGENTDAIKKTTGVLLDDSKEVGPEVNLEKTKYMLMSHNQKIGPKHSTEIANRSFGDVAKLKSLGTTLTDQN
jgi:hypothetical protein